MTKENEIHLKEFSFWLKEKEVSQKAISQHVSNVEFFANEFLTYYEIVRQEDGIGSVGSFLGDWFIRKAGWSNEKELKTNALSLTKLYEYLTEKGEVNPEEFQELQSKIHDNLGEWIEAVNRYNDPTVDLDEVWEY